MVESVIFLAVFGAATGSFITLWVNRFDSGLPIIVGRSQCDSCHQSLRWWELIPIASFLLQKGKCVRCKAKLSPHYLVFELISATAFVLVGEKVLTINQPALIIFELLFLVLLLFLMFYDWLTLTFPTTILYVSAGVVLGLLAINTWLGLILHRIEISDPMFSWLSTPSQPWVNQITGGLVGAGLLALLAVPSRGRWMGYGDIMIGLLLGVWLGYPSILVATVLAFYIGAIVGIIKILTKKVPSDHRLAFGPCLIAAGIATYGYGDKMIVWILNIMGVVV